MWSAYNLGLIRQLLTQCRKGTSRLFSVITGYYVLGSDENRFVVPFNDYCRNSMNIEQDHTVDRQSNVLAKLSEKNDSLATMEWTLSVKLND